MADSPLEWSPDEIRRLGYAIVDAVAERWGGLRDSDPWRGGTREREPSR